MYESITIFFLCPQMGETPHGDGGSIPASAPRGLPNPGPGLLGAPPPMMGRDGDKQAQGGADRWVEACE